MHNEKRLKLPTNIKQVGNISQGIKIYVEDYVYTYIQQYASFAECEEKIGVLTGKKNVYEEEDILFINGIIQGKYSKNNAGMEVLSEKSKQYIKEQMRKYFPGDEILGWVYIQPGYGDFLNNTLISYHNANFKKYYNVLFIYDPLEKVNGFFCKNEVTEELEQVKGYFIYYDRNEGMHEYMLQNRLIKPKEELTENSEGEEAAKSSEDVVEKIRNSFSNGKFPKKRRVRKKGKIVTEQKKLVNFLGTLCAGLFFACFIMGASIIKNDDRINNVEKQIAAMDNSYTYLIKTIKEGNVQNVFAAQNGSAKSELNSNNTSVSEKSESEKPEKKTAEKTAENTTQKSTEKASENVTEKVTEKITEKETEKKTEKETEKTTVSKPVSQKEQNDENSGASKKYTVEDGDSLSGISIKIYGTRKKMADIMEKNNLDDPDKIYSGMVIELP